MFFGETIITYSFAVRFLYRKDQHALDTLLDYYQVLRDAKAGEADINNKYYNQVLAQRYQLPPGGIQPTYHSDNRPDRGRKPSYLRNPHKWCR